MLAIGCSESDNFEVNEHSNFQAQSGSSTQLLEVDILNELISEGATVISVPVNWTPVYVDYPIYAPYLNFTMLELNGQYIEVYKFNPNYIGTVQNGGEENDDRCDKKHESTEDPQDETKTLVACEDPGNECNVEIGDLDPQTGKNLAVICCL